MNKTAQKHAEIVSRIAFLLEKHGLTQQDLANKTGFPKGYISGIMHGTRKPTISSIVRLEAAFGDTIIIVPKH